MFAIFVALTASIVVFAILPIFTVLRQAAWTEAWFDLTALVTTLSQPYVWRTFANTVLLALTSGTVATVARFILAFAVTRTSMRGKAFVQGVALLPIISPPFIMALTIIMLFDRSGLITRGIFGIRTASVYGFHSQVLTQCLAFTPIVYLNIRGTLLSFAAPGTILN